MTLKPKHHKIEFTGLGIAERMDVCKARMIRAFNREWRASRSRERAYDSGISSLERSIRRFDITNPRVRKGLLGELVYYYQRFTEHSLTPVTASGHHFDFSGVINKRPAGVDVTTNPDYKSPENFQEISELYSDEMDYYVAVVDPDNRESRSYPLLLPICDDGTVGHFILIIEETELESLGGPAMGLSDRQLLVRYNPSAGDDVGALEKVIATWNFIVTRPASTYHEIMGAAHSPEIYRSPKEAMQEYDQFASSLAADFRQESGLILSGIAESESEYIKPQDEEDWLTRLYWTHEHKYVRTRVGKPLEVLDFNIAGIAYDLY